MAAVTLRDISVHLDHRPVLERITCEIPDHAFIAIVGPSGSGKSTLLRTIAGLVLPTAGHVYFDGIDVTRRPPAERDVGMVFQSPALLPNRSVRGNVEFPLELRHETADSIRDRVAAETRALHIEHLLRRRPSTLSRGEQQLVQIARTMVRSPRVLLLDEPFAPLDQHVRSAMRSEIRMLQRGYGVTTVMATNDPVDAMALASMIAVLDGAPASIVQIGTPAEVHDEPATLDIAAATGALWTVRARVEADRDGYWLVADGAVRLRAWSPDFAGYVGRNVDVGVRTDDLIRDERGVATALLRRIVPGSEPALLCTWGGRMVTARGSASASEVGLPIRLRVDRAIVFDVDDGRRLA